MSNNLISTAPISYAAMLSLIQTAAAAADPPVTVVPGDVLQFEPGQYICVSTIANQQFNIEATGYAFIESYSITGECTVFTGDDEVSKPGTVVAVMTAAYGLFTDYVMATVVANRGGSGVPVLGILTTPSPFEILAGYSTYVHGPGNVAGGQGGWGGTVNWSYNLRAFLSPDNSYS